MHSCYHNIYDIIGQNEDLLFSVEERIPFMSQDYYLRMCKFEYEFDDLEPQGFLENAGNQFIEQVADVFAKTLGDVNSRTYILDIFTTLCWVSGRLCKVDDYKDVLAIGDYITRIHFNQPICVFLFDFLLGQSLDAQTIDWSVLKSVISTYESLKTHPAVVKFIKIITLAFSGGIFASLGIEVKMAEVWEMVTESVKKILHHTDFISAIIDLFQFVGERISAFCVTKSWKSLIHTPTNYSDWVDDAYLILDRSAALANPQAIGIDYHEYVQSLARTIEMGEEIRRYVKSGDAKDGVSHMLSRLRVLYNDILINEAAGEFRMAPFAMLLSAGSGVGKSCFLDTCKTHFAKVYNKPLGKEFVYCRTPQEKHWNNFKTPMWCVIIDDIASINPNSGSEDPSLSDILLGIGNTGFSPPQASLEDKGKTPFMCELLMATTNTEDLKAHCWFNNPQAIRRRLPFIVNLIPKEEYRIPGTNMLNKSTIPVTLPGYYPDLWTITVKEVLVEPNETISTHVVLSTDSIYVFMQHFNKWSADHRQGQIAFMASRDNTLHVEVCHIHLLPIKICGCSSDDSSDNDYIELEPQVGDLVSLEPQLYELPQVTPELITKICLGGAVAYGSVKVSSFMARRCSEAINADPLIVNSPTRLILNTTARALKLGQAYAAKKIEKLKLLTKDKLKDLLRSAIYAKFEEYKPLLKKVLIGLSVLASMGLTWTLLRKEIPGMLDLDMQVDIDKVGLNPKPAKEMENVWRKDDYQPSEFLGRLSQSWSSLTMTKAASLVARNTVWCKTTHGDNKHSNFRALCLAGHLYVVPHHVLPHDEYFNMQVIHENSAEGCNGNVHFKIAQNSILRHPEKELAFFEINHMPGRRDITGILPKRGYLFDAPGRMIIRQANSTIEYLDTKRTHLVPQQFMEQFNITLDACSSHITRDTLKGDCGAPTVVQQPNAIILGGIHILGGHRHLAVSVPVYQEDFISAQQHFRTPIVENDIPFLEGQNFTTNISQKCTARYVDHGTLQVFGSFNGFKRQPKSSACNTLLTDLLLQDGHILKYGPAPMKGYMPLHIGIKEIVQKDMNFKCDILRKCSLSFSDSVIKNLPQNFVEELRSPLTLKSALNGYPGTRFIDSMNFSTSAGYPYNSSKRNFIMRVPQDDTWQHPIILTDDIKREVNVIWDNMLIGISSAPVFTQHIKDEALPLRKVSEGKARLFMGGPFAWSVCVRMALLPFIRVMQMNKYLFECAPGTNATSIEWSRIYTYITKHGPDRLIAGDFKSFDKNMGALVILEAFSFIRNIMQHCGAEIAHLKCIQVIAEDVSFAFVNFNGDLMRFFGSNPSGHPLTVIINCIVNSLYMRYCYFELNPAKEVDSFKTNVSLLTYGDDNMANSAVDWFNHTSISHVLQEVGIGYTMADKLAQSVPFISIDQTSFLKRTFRYEISLDAHMAVLEEDSIWKSMLIWIPSKEISPQKQTIDIVTSAVSEWFFYGRDRFEKERDYLISLINRADLDYYIEDNTFPTWDQLFDRFVIASNDYLAQEPLSSVRILGKCLWESTIHLD